MKKVLVFLFSLLFSFEALAAPKVVHVNVALCDNIYQRIVPVPWKLGKGNDPEQNLYWGLCMGRKTTLRTQKNGH